jgi:hypothetical protein
MMRRVLLVTVCVVGAGLSGCHDNGRYNLVSGTTGWIRIDTRTGAMEQVLGDPKTGEIVTLTELHRRQQPQ